VGLVNAREGKGEVAVCDGGGKKKASDQQKNRRGLCLSSRGSLLLSCFRGTADLNIIRRTQEKGEAFSTLTGFGDWALEKKKIRTKP